MTVRSLYIYQTVLFGMQNMNKSFWWVGGVRGGLSWGYVAFFWESGPKIQSSYRDLNPNTLEHKANTPWRRSLVSIDSFLTICYTFSNSIQQNENKLYVI